MLRAYRQRRNRNRHQRTNDSLEALEPRMLLAADLDLTSASKAIDVGSSVLNAEVRNVDGSGNNLADSSQGAAKTNVIRFGYPAVYPDGHGDAIEVDGQPNARDISNSINAQDESIINGGEGSCF